MLQELLLLLAGPFESIGTWPLLATGILSLAVWVAGARMSRAMITLGAVAAAAIVGLQVPSWFLLPLSGWAVATVLALLVGLVAFVTHKAWVSVALGLALAVWTVSAILGYYVLSAQWAWPAAPADATLTACASNAWSTLPEDLRRTLPFATATALVAGVAASVMWPRLSTVMLYSLAGVLVFTVVVGALLQRGRPQWLVVLPSSTTVQLGVLGVLVVLGAVIQWRLACAPAMPTADKKTDEPERRV